MPLKDKKKNNEYHKVYMQKVRSKLKTEKKKQETLTINEQYQQGNLNYGVKMSVPKPLTLEQFKQENPNTEFWDYIDYKKGLFKPRIEKIKTPEQQQLSEIEAMKRGYILEQLGYSDPNKPQLGFNFFNPESEKTDREVHEEKNRETQDHIDAILKQQKA